MRPDSDLTSLNQNQAHYAAILNSSVDAIFSKNLKNQITSWNQAAEDLFNIKAQDIIGSSDQDLIPENFRAEEDLALQRVLAGEKIPAFETRRQTREKKPIDVSIRISPIKNEQGKIIGTSQIAREISAANLKELELLRLSRLYSSVLKIGQALMGAQTRSDLLKNICRSLTEDAGFRMSWIGWLDADSKEITPIAQSGDEAGYLNKIKIYADDRVEGMGPTGRAFRQNSSYISNDLLNDPASTPWRNQLKAHGYAASAAFTICEKGAPKGTLSVYSDQVGYFQDKEVELLSKVTSDISFALDNMRIKSEQMIAQATAMGERLFSDTMIESMPGLLYFYDESGRFLRWNKNFERVSGYSHEEIAKMHPLDFFSEGVRANVKNRIAEVFEKGESFIEAPFMSKDGTSTPHFLTGKRIVLGDSVCLVGVGIDVSDKILAEQARLEIEASYQTLFHYAPDGILIGDSQSTYLDANASICQMLGYKRSELIGLNASDIIVSEGRQAIDQAIDEIQSRLDHHKEWIFKRKDGSTFPAEVMATLMPNGNLMGIVRDITERKETEKKLRDLNESLESKVELRTQELKAALSQAQVADQLKSAFLATMSHELRTPLNSIIGFTGIILQELAGPLNAEQSKQLSMVRSSAKHLLELINDVLDLSKIEANQLDVEHKDFDLNESVDRVVNVVRNDAERKGLYLKVLCPKELGLWRGDRRRTEQILMNLINNAIKFTERGGIEVSVEIQKSPRILLVRVKDTGIGIKAEDLELLFLPFRQLDSGLTRNHEGTGLGLAICRRLAGLLDGDIQVQSEWLKGSEFTLKLLSREN